MSETIQNRDPQLWVNTPGVIGFYEREFYMFSNFSSFQVNWQGTDWMTSEHAYQAAKFMPVNPSLVDRIGLARSAHGAYSLARMHNDERPPGWNDIKVHTMLDICRHKLAQHAYIRIKLDATRDMRLVEDSPKDSFWGIGPDGQGQNQLGTIWMQLREELRNGDIEIQS